MSSIYIVTKEMETARKLQSELTNWGFSCFTGNLKDKVVDRVVKDVPHLVILELNGPTSLTVLQELTTSAKIRKKVPVMGLVSLESSDSK